MTSPPINVTEELATLAGLTTNQLCDRYAELFGHPARTRHKAYLLRKVAWRIQARAEGDLSERARRRAAELADDADVRVMPPRSSAPVTMPPGAQRVVTAVGLVAPLDPRLPPAGTVLLREYKGRTLRVTVLADGFEFDGERFKTLTAVAVKVTGSHLNGFRFFRLDKESKQ